MNRKILAIALVTCGLCWSQHAAAKSPTKAKKAKPLSVSAKLDRLNANQAKVIANQERELQQLREILRQMQATQSREPGVAYPYTYP